MTKQEGTLAEVVSNITREKDVVVSMPSFSAVSLLTITIKLSQPQSVYFCKKINERVISCISGAYKLVIVDYQCGGDTIYNYTQTNDGKNEGFNFTA